MDFSIVQLCLKDFLIRQFIFIYVYGKSPVYCLYVHKLRLGTPLSQGVEKQEGPSALQPTTESCT